jgi:uncharacterized LabA/DUF88 family protein
VLTAYCFIDGGHLRAGARKYRKALVDPRALTENIAYSYRVQGWRTPGMVSAGKLFASGIPRPVSLARVLYYDARPDEKDPRDSAIEDYWKAIELLPDTEIGFGALRGRPRRQKKVDGLIAVDMMVGAFTNLFQVAILVAGDSDFVPVVNEVRRRGVMVVVAGIQESLADELKRAADRVWPIEPSGSTVTEFPPLRHEGKVWLETDDGTVSVVKE